jgi:hypothetical protein
MAASGEAVVVDGLATRAQRPRGWANRKVLYDAKRHAHTAQGLALSTIHGDLLWCDGGWPGSCHEHELIELAGLQGGAGRRRALRRWRGCCTASGTSTGPPARSSALAAGYTESLP